MLMTGDWWRAAPEAGLVLLLELPNTEYDGFVEAVAEVSVSSVEKTCAGIQDGRREIPSVWGIHTQYVYI